MGNVVRTNIDFEYICGLVKEIYNHSFGKEAVENAINKLIPRDDDGEQLIDYSITRRSDYYARFSPQDETIYIALENLYNWVDTNAYDICKTYGIEDNRLVGSYLCVLALLHKIEHSYQYLMATDRVEAPCNMIKQGYRTLFDIMEPYEYYRCGLVTQIKKSISLAIYESRKKEFIIERNAQFNALSTLANVAFENQHYEIRGALLGIRNSFAVAGYTKNNQGPLINTYRSLLIKKELENLEHDYDDISMMDRFRFGLPVDDETRERILALR